MSVFIQNSNPRNRVSIIEPRINEMGLYMYITVWLRPYLAVDYDAGEFGGRKPIFLLPKPIAKRRDLSKAKDKTRFKKCVSEDLR